MHYNLEQFVYYLYVTYIYKMIVYTFKKMLKNNNLYIYLERE